MAFRGDRFILNLDSDEEELPPASSENAPTLAIPGMIGEIRERSPAANPAPPTLKPTTTGFPAHRRRNNPSAFKQRRAPGTSSVTAPSGTASNSATENAENDEKQAIAEQNDRQLASMSQAQIQQEREELLESLDPSLLERFLRRARIDDTESASPSAQPPQQPPPPPSENQATERTENLERNSGTKPEPKHAQPSSQDEHPSSSSKTTPQPSTNPSIDDLPPPQLPDDLHPAAAASLPLSGSVHFPTAPSASTMPNLDPSSPNFLTDLQTHYFPNIAHDPSSLSWLQPPSASDEDPDSTSPYHPASTAEAIHPANLRFSLLGTILSPSTSLSLPTSLGLHHHGKDPHAAGYTIPELAILSRSTFAAQRCIAWQVLGRILFRLGKGQFGERGTPLVEGLWGTIEKEGVVAGMLAEADDSGDTDRARNRGQQKEQSGEAEQKEESVEEGAESSSAKDGDRRRHHASATAWAVEGVWLWQMGGGGDRGILKAGAVRSQ
ncbi:uncharacterized protein BO97DRAFT_447327 [Aspergillus homomorphus CBS 101889]|uniref:Transcription factor Rba50 n=1 Tax=Aspergillus homomorphus (strain CBS 101889) TaxID=1450537 RepID=A0A395HGZ8_ASPHC|nr:hypothetical protein BO97DRAFT_447327 [Aspergillus homomorphus CBS 101889]RAL06763.1 hypothetical protein BO97DRAFT_447327 [Aspergillus homomorphus CBS 101889]